MAVRTKHKHESPIRERVFLDLVDASQRLLKESRERLAECRRLRETYDQLLKEFRQRRKSG